MKSILNSSSWAVVVISPRFLIQFRLESSVHTHLDLNLAREYRFGAKSLGASPWRHLPSQKGVLLPFPMVMLVEQKNSCESHLPTHLKAMMVAEEAEPNAVVDVLRVAVQVVPKAHGGVPRTRQVPLPCGPQQHFPHRRC
jgi:hypothetical protein